MIYEDCVYEVTDTGDDSYKIVCLVIAQDDYQFELLIVESTDDTTGESFGLAHSDINHPNDCMRYKYLGDKEEFPEYLI
jgi:hypothetical protein